MTEAVRLQSLQVEAVVADHMTTPTFPVFTFASGLAIQNQTDIATVSGLCMMTHYLWIL